jgi:hypothetical protein
VYGLKMCSRKKENRKKKYEVLFFLSSLCIHTPQGNTSPEWYFTKPSLAFAESKPSLGHTTSYNIYKVVEWDAFMFLIKTW